MQLFKILLVFTGFSLMPITPANASTVDLGSCFAALIKQYQNVRDLDDSELSLLSSSSKNCRRLVQSLTRGDEIIFTDGNRFKIGEKLGEGEAATIWTVITNEKVAIRIPKGDIYNFRQMEVFLAGWTRIKKLKVPAIEIIDPENGTLEYQLVQRVDFLFTFEQWLKKFKNLGATRIKKSDFVAALKALPLFAEHTAIVSQLGDGLQMGFDGTSWRLFDFRLNNLTFLEKAHGNDLSQQTVWDNELSRDPLEKKLQRIALQIRTKLCEVILSQKRIKK